MGERAAASASAERAAASAVARDEMAVSGGDVPDLEIVAFCWYDSKPVHFLTTAVEAQLLGADFELDMSEDTVGSARVRRLALRDDVGA